MMHKPTSVPSTKDIIPSTSATSSKGHLLRNSSIQRTIEDHKGTNSPSTLTNQLITVLPQQVTTKNLLAIKNSFELLTNSNDLVDQTTSPNLVDQTTSPTLELVAQPQEMDTSAGSIQLPPYLPAPPLENNLRNYPISL